MRPVILSTVAAALVLTSASAFALERNTADMRKNRGIIVADVPRHEDPLPNATPAPAPKDVPAVAPAKPNPAGAGFVLELRSTLNVLQGEIADGLAVGGAFAVVDLRIGAYVTPHVGIVTGLSAGIGP